MEAAEVLDLPRSPFCSNEGGHFLLPFLTLFITLLCTTHIFLFTFFKPPTRLTFLLIKSFFPLCFLRGYSSRCSLVAPLFPKLGVNDCARSWRLCNALPQHDRTHICHIYPSAECGYHSPGLQRCCLSSLILA